MPALRGRAQRPPHSSLCCHHRLDDNFRRAIGKSNNPGTIIASTIDLIPSAALIRNCVGIQWKSIGKTFNVQSEIVPRDTIKRDMPSETCRSCTSLGWAPGLLASSLLVSRVLCADFALERGDEEADGIYGLPDILIIDLFMGLVSVSVGFSLGLFCGLFRD